jgi:hypothetical protein
MGTLIHSYYYCHLHNHHHHRHRAAVNKFRSNDSWKNCGPLYPRFIKNKAISIRIWCRSFVCVHVYLCLLCCLYCRSVHCSGTICTFPLVDVFVSFVPYFFISLTFMLFRRLENLFPFSFAHGYFALIVLWRKNVTIVLIKSTLFSKNQKVSCSYRCRLSHGFIAPRPLYTGPLCPTLE